MNTQRTFWSGLFLCMIIAIPVAAQASSGAGGLGSGRLLPTLAAVIGLTGIVMGWRARNGSSQAMAIVSGVSGLVSLAIGVLHASNSAGTFGTGNGLAGAVVAIILGLVSVAIGLLAFVRSRRVTK